jgi:enoyl-CoA hydratase/carnithine racemase
VASLELAREAYRGIDGLRLGDLAAAASYAESSAWQIEGMKALGQDEKARQIGEEAIKVAETIAALSQPSLIAAKEAVNRSFETSLAEGVRVERRVVHALFATKDRKEGMTAFIEKRPPRFTNE